MSAQNNVQIVRRWIKAHQKRDLDSIAGLLTSNVVFESAGEEKPVKGFDAYRESMESLWEAFPDLEGKPEEFIATDNAVVVRWRDSGTHQGEAFGLKATKRKINITGCTIFRFKNDKINSVHVYQDTLALIRQLAAQ